MLLTHNIILFHYLRDSQLGDTAIKSQQEVASKETKPLLLASKAEVMDSTEELHGTEGKPLTPNDKGKRFTMSVLVSTNSNQLLPS